jgi:hypothetical protein
MMPDFSVVLHLVARGQTSDKKVDLPSRWDLTGVRPLGPARWAIVGCPCGTWQRIGR